MFFFFKQKTAYEMRISDWSSDVCSSDLCSYERIQYFGSACDDLKSASLCLRRARASCRTGGADRQDRTLHHRRRRREAPAARIYRQAPGAHVRPRQSPPAAREPYSRRSQGWAARRYVQIGRAHVCTTVTKAHLVTR